MREPNKAYLIKALVSIIALATLVYAPSLQNSFVGDDAAIIVSNDFIKNSKNIPVVFSKAYLTRVKDLNFLGARDLGAGEVSYRPVATLSYFADYRLWKLDPFGYHLTNLLLHIINALLVFFLAGLITGKPGVALPAALLFAVHPVNSEAINAVCFREDLLAFMFFAAAFIFYIVSEKPATGEKPWAYGLSLTMFFFALFSKEMAVTLPLILILYDRYFIKPGSRSCRPFSFKPRYAGYLAVLLFYLLVWGVIFKNPNPPAGYPGGSFSANVMTLSTVIAGYIRQAVIPLQLHFMVTEAHLVIRHFNLKVLFSLLLITACIAAAVKLRKSAKEASFSIAWFFITLLPVVNIFPLKQIIGLRYLYLPMAGFCIFLALGLKKTAGKLIRFTLAIILVVYAVLSLDRIAVWSDNISLWSEIAAMYPDNHFAHYGLGEVFVKSGMPDKAIKEFKKSLRLNPKNASVHYELAELYVAVGRRAEAQRAYQAAIEIDPVYLEAYNNLAALYSETGRVDDAILLWEKAVKLQPLFLPAHFNLSVFYFQKGEYAAAIRHADAVAAAGGSSDPKFLELLKPHRKSKG